MKIFKNLPKDQWGSLLARPELDNEKLSGEVRAVLDAVKKDGMDAVRQYSLKFDGYDPNPVSISEEEITEAVNFLEPKLKKAIDRAARNIEIFHRNQQIEWPVVFISKSIQCWQRNVPIEKVGFYIPGGTAPLFSTVLMLGIPAMIAGCEDIELCTPADRNGKVHPAVLYAASLCGIKNINRIGGIQAIAAMAYGAGSVFSVDKIFGPGNQYVTQAKQLVSQEGIAIDMPAGPSEVLVMADETADPAYVAADLLSQAEHGADSQVVLLCYSQKFADQVMTQLEKQLPLLPREQIARKALDNSYILILDEVEDMMEFSNRYAPEHLIISVSEPRRWAEKVRNAGSVFIGNYTPESAGDYASGTNHTLPTNGYAKSFSGLTIQSFMKTIQFQEIQKSGLEDLGPDIINMANAEGLRAHARAVEIRTNNSNE